MNIDRNIDKYTSDVLEICSPLKKLGIEYFSHLRIYDNKNYTVLTTHPDWYKFLWKKEIDVGFDISELKNGLYLWSDFAKDELMQYAAEFDLRNAGFLFLMGENYIDVFNFSTGKNIKMNANFYL